MSVRVPLSGALGLALVLTGCSTSIFGSKENGWRRQAEAVCVAKDGVAQSRYVERVSRIDGNGACGIHYPLKAYAASNGRVSFDEPITANCNVLSAFDGWVDHAVQPAAAQLYGARVVGVELYGGYNCRTRNGRRGAKLSEHGFGNAIDVAGFTLSDGRTISVEKDWRGDPWAAAFLRVAHGGACEIFSTVIGPDGDRHHQDHFHFDLARHNAKSGYRYCK